MLSLCAKCKGKLRLCLQNKKKQKKYFLFLLIFKCKLNWGTYLHNSCIVRLLVSSNSALRFLFLFHNLETRNERERPFDVHVWWETLLWSRAASSHCHITFPLASNHYFFYFFGFPALIPSFSLVFFSLFPPFVSPRSHFPSVVFSLLVSYSVFLPCFLSFSLP